MQHLKWAFTVLGTDLIVNVVAFRGDVTVHIIYNIQVNNVEVTYMYMYIVHIKGCTQTGQPNVSCLVRCPYFRVC